MMSSNLSRRRTFATSLTLCLMAASAAGISNAQESSSQLPLETFASMPEVDHLRQAPGGKRVAFMSHIEGQVVVVVQNLDGSDRHLHRSAKGADIFDFRWASSNRLLIMYRLQDELSSIKQEVEPALQNISDVVIDALGDRQITNSVNVNIRTVTLDRQGAATRLAAVDADGSHFEWVVKPSRRKTSSSNIGRPLANPIWQTDIIDMLPDDPDHILLAVDGDFDGRPEVRHLNVRTGRFKDIHDGFRGTQYWMSDSSGVLRFAWGWWKDKAIGYWRSESGEWQQLDNPVWTHTYDVLAVDTERDHVLVAAPADNGRNGLFRLHVPTGRLGEQLFAHDAVDGAEPVYAAETGRLVGVGYAHEQAEYHFLDGRRASLYRAMRRALPGNSISIEGFDDTAGRYLILASNDRDPGMYYQYDSKTKQLASVAPRQSVVDPEQMAATTLMSVPASDGTQIPVYLTLPAAGGSSLPAVILAHDGPGERADARWDYLAQFLANRGYAVIKPNFRGSGGYGPGFEEAGYNEWGGLMQRDIADVARHLIDAGTIDADRLCIAGSAYGGYAALMGVIQSPDLFQCAVSVNGMVDLDKVKRDAAFLFGDADWPDRVGGKDGDTASVSPLARAAAIGRPVLLIAAEDDNLIDHRDTKRLHDRLQELGKPCDLLLLEDGGHTLSSTDARTRQLAALEAFLKDNIGG